jgi:NAD(P)-dependent dehydrogenase (short-subunit alcohol dehydrogenase family)
MAANAEKKVWLVTVAGRGMGVDIARAALAAGHAVVATGRNAERVSAALGKHDDLPAVALDVTDPASASAAVQAALDRFGRIDTLVNNAGNFYAGFFEEITPEDFRAQMETNFFGPLNVTRAVLPVMRARRSGLVVTVSSTAGLIGQEFCTAYAASKFALEGWSELLTPEVAPFGIRTMLVEPGFFPTELLSQDSTSYAKPAIEDYAVRTRRTVTAWSGMNGQQGGDPAKLARRWSSSPARASRRCGGPPALTPSGSSSRRLTSCSPRPTHTENCPARWPTTTPRRRTSDMRRIGPGYCVLCNHAAERDAIVADSFADQMAR